MRAVISKKSAPRNPFSLLHKSAATLCCQTCQMALRKCWMEPVIKRKGERPGRIQPVPEEANFLGRVNKEMNGPMTKGPSGSIIQKSKNEIFLFRPRGQIPSGLPKATPDNEECRIRTTRGIQLARQSRSVGHGEFFRPDRTGDLSTKCTDSTKCTE